MPHKKRAFKNTKPPLFRIFCRQRMGKDAGSQPLTTEHDTKTCFADKKSAVYYIQSQRDHGQIFIIRDRAGGMVNSFVWKHSQNKWGVINREGYFGGFKIGNPHDQSGPAPHQCLLCSRQSSDEVHPCVHAH